MDNSLMSHINPFGSYRLRHTLMNDMKLWASPGFEAVIAHLPGECSTN